MIALHPTYLQLGHGAHDDGADAAVVPPSDPRAVPPGGPPVRLVEVDAFVASRVADACRSADGEIAAFGGAPLTCPQAIDPLRVRVREAVALPVHGLLLDRPDAWYAAGASEAGFCRRCSAAFNHALTEIYGEQFVAGDFLEPDDWDEKTPFSGERRALRLSQGLRPGMELAWEVRKEARLQSRTLLVGARFCGLNAAAVQLARRLDFAVVPALAPASGRARAGTYEIFRAALGGRGLAAALDSATARNPHLVLQAARLATAVGAEVALPADAPQESHAALGSHRAFWKGFRQRFRPSERLAEVLLLYSPECDHFTNGAHGGGVRAAAEALTSFGAQYRVVLSIPPTGSEPVVLVDAAALPEEEAERLRKRVRDGAGAVVVGSCGSVDEEGRPLSGPFGELRDGLNQEGAGTVFALDLKRGSLAADRLWEPIARPLDRALGSLLGRGRRAAGFSVPGVAVKMYLDPDRKLDVHLVHTRFDAAGGRPLPVRDARLHIAGSAVGGARTASLFLPDGSEVRLPLRPWGVGVQVDLPELPGAAVLTVAR